MKHTLNIYLVKSGHKSAIILPKNTDDIKDIKIETDTEANSRELRIVIPKTQRSSLPPWTQLLTNLNNDLAELFIGGASNKALIETTVYKSGKSLRFLLSFGRCSGMINNKAIEHSFGLKIALSVLDTKETKGISHRDLTALGLLTNTSSANCAEFGNFGLDTSAQLLGSVSGRTTESMVQWFGNIVAGRHAFVCKPDLSKNKLPDILSVVADTWQNAGYKTKFPWLEHIVHLGSRGDNPELDKALQKALHTNHRAASLGIPVAQDSDRLYQYAFGIHKPNKNNRTNTLDLSTYIEKRINATDRGWRHRLDRDHIFLLENGLIQQKWSVSSCIYCSFNYNGQHIFHEGNFYRVDRKFENRLNNSLAIHLAQNSFCPTWKRNINEDEYNKSELSSSLTSQGHCSVILDKKNISSPFAAKSKVELADVVARIDNRHVLFYVKKYINSQSISYVSSQAAVSTNTLSQEADFRSAADQLLQKHGYTRIFQEGFKPSDIEIRIAVGVPSRISDLAKLPFFAKLVLNLQAKKIKSLGFEFQVELVPHQ